MTTLTGQQTKGNDMGTYRKEDHPRNPADGRFTDKPKVGAGVPRADGGGLAPGPVMEPDAFLRENGYDGPTPDGFDNLDYLTEFDPNRFDDDAEGGHECCVACSGPVISATCSACGQHVCSRCLRDMADNQGGRHRVCELCATMAMRRVGLTPGEDGGWEPDRPRMADDMTVLGIVRDSVGDQPRMLALDLPDGSTVRGWAGDMEPIGTVPSGWRVVHMAERERNDGTTLLMGTDSADDPDWRLDVALPSTVADEARNHAFDTESWGFQEPLPPHPARERAAWETQRPTDAAGMRRWRDGIVSELEAVSAWDAKHGLAVDMRGPVVSVGDPARVLTRPQVDAVCRGDRMVFDRAYALSAEGAQARADGEDSSRAHADLEHWDDPDWWHARAGAEFRHDRVDPDGLVCGWQSVSVRPEDYGDWHAVPDDALARVQARYGLDAAQETEPLGRSVAD